MKRNNHVSVVRLTSLAILAALVVVLQTVASGLGVAILPSRLCPANSEDSRVVTRVMTEPRMTHHLYAIWKKGRFLSRAARLWIEFTKDHLTMLNDDKKLDDEMRK